jgi:hypothetical protein
MSAATALSLAPTTAAVLGAPLLAAGFARDVGAALIVGYAGVLVLSAVHAGMRFRSLAVGLLQPFAIIASQVAYSYGFVGGLMERAAQDVATAKL